MKNSIYMTNMLSRLYTRTVRLLVICRESFLVQQNYRRSALVQGGMEIPCTVNFRMPSTLKNAQLAERYLKLVQERYMEPNNEKILWSFVTEALVEASISQSENHGVRMGSKKKTQKNSKPYRDIREMFAATGKKPRKKPIVIKLD